MLAYMIIEAYMPVYMILSKIFASALLNAANAFN